MRGVVGCPMHRVGHIVVVAIDDGLTGIGQRIAYRGRRIRRPRPDCGGGIDRVGDVVFGTPRVGIKVY